MMKIKRFLSVLLSILLVLSSVPVFASAATSTDGYLTYEIVDGEAHITDCDESVTGAYTVPSTLGGYPVTSIGDYAFSRCSSLTSIAIPDSVASIGTQTFSYCTSLRSITVDEKNEYYSSDAYGVLFDKDKTKLVQFPEGSNLMSYSIPDSVISVGDLSFYGCTSLTSVTLGNNVASVGDSAFYGCLALEMITISESVTSIGTYAFCRCTSLASITIPSAVTSIGVEALGYYLYTGNIIEGFTIYGYDGTAAETYANENGITFISLGEYIAPVEPTTDEATEQTSPDGYLTYTVSNGEATITACDSSISGAYTIPSTLGGYPVTTIGNGAFENCTSLTSVAIPDSVTIIDDWAFYDCTSLASVTIPDNITYIGYYAFGDCSSLTTVVIGSGITSINNQFYKCVSLMEITIPASVTSITEYDLGCHIIEGEISSYYELNEGFTIYGYDGTAAETYANENGITFISLGEYIEPTTTEPTTAEPTTAPATTEPVTADGQVIIILGDVNGDNKVTAADARLALRIAAKLNDGTDKELAAADLDGNGKVATSEARTILRMAALLEESMGTIVFGEPVTTVPATEEPATAVPTTAEPTTAEPTTAEKAKITAEVTDAYVGEEVEVTFSVENFAGAECGVIYFTYDPDTLEFVSAEVHNSAGMESFAGNDIYNDNRLGYGFMFLENSEDDSAEFLSVTFKALRSGDTTVTWEWDEAEGIDVILNGSADLEVFSEESTTAETTTVEPTTEELTTAELTTAVPTTAELTTEEPTTEEPTTVEPTTEEPAAAEIPEGAVAYSDFPDEMKAFLDCSFGFTGRVVYLRSGGLSETITVKTDGTNIKKTETLDMDSFGEYAVTVIVLSSADSDEETNDAYVVCEDTGKIMSLSVLPASSQAAKDSELNIEDYTVEIDEDTDSLYAYVTIETGTDGVEYTVYSADTSDGMVKFYFDEDGIASVIKYSTAGFVQKKFMFDEFYTDISDSEFDISVYDNTTSLTALFGVSIV